MRWTNKRDNLEPWEIRNSTTRTPADDEQSKLNRFLRSDMMSKVFVGLGVCGSIALIALLSWGVLSSRFAKMAAEEPGIAVNEMTEPTITAGSMHAIIGEEAIFKAITNNMRTGGTDVFSLEVKQGAVVADLPLVPADTTDKWPNAVQLLYLETHGENPSMSTLQRYGITDVYNAEGEALSTDSATSVLPETPAYADGNQETQLIYYGGCIYAVEPGKTVLGKFIKPAYPGEIDVRSSTDSGHGYVVENQHYSFERMDESQLYALVHFENADSGEAMADDFVVFFNSGDRIEITYPVTIDDRMPLSPGGWSWNACEVTVKYYEEADVYVRAPSVTCIN